MSGAADVIDLGTSEGVARWVHELPDENLRAIAGRPLDQTNFLLVVAAELELIVRDSGGQQASAGQRPAI